ncbi:MAG: hypothetical protein ACRDCK_02815, partial [Plesiomonas shigelloides]
MAIASGRVNVREGVCPVPGCGKATSRMDRQLKAHSELSRETRRRAFKALKVAKILNDVAALRASNPAVAMVSTLDLQEACDPDDPSFVLEEAVAEEAAAAPPCDDPRCQRDRSEKEDLSRQVDTLSKALRVLTRR